MSSSDSIKDILDELNLSLDQKHKDNIKLGLERILSYALGPE